MSRHEEDWSRGDRDLEREPSAPVPRRDQAAMLARTIRKEYEVSVALARNTKIHGTPCPSCTTTVYVPADSEGERVGCYGCGIQLITAQGEDGHVEVRRR